MKSITFLSLIILPLTFLFAQESPEISTSYQLKEIRVEGAELSNQQEILRISGLEEGMWLTLPGVQTADAIKRLWNTELFGDIQLVQDSIVDKAVYLRLILQERPRISQISFTGINKKQADELRKQIQYVRGSILTPAKSHSAKRKIRNYFVEKGYYNSEIRFLQQQDAVLRYGLELQINIAKGEKTRIREIEILDNEAFADAKVRRQLKGIKVRKWWRFWDNARYIPRKYKDAKKTLLSWYQDQGYRDAHIVADTLAWTSPGDLKVQIRLEEGRQYVFRNISWMGNQIYDSKTLTQLLGIQRGDIYNKSLLEQRLYADPGGTDISSLFLNQGHLFFRVEAVESLIEGDSIDIEMRMYEGPLAVIGSVHVSGNTKTSDEVILRDIRTRPGDVFNRAALIRSQRELINTNYFSAEDLEVLPVPNEGKGTVDLHYKLVEKPSDKFQLMGGWSPRVFDDNGNIISGGPTGTLMLDFNNFSTKRLFNKHAWKPVPGGDGQRLSLAYQTTGSRSKNFSFSFQEPWLGGKKPNFLGVNLGYFSFRNLITLDSSENAAWFSNQTFTASVDYSTRLNFPDDYTFSRTSLGYRYYALENPGIYYPEFEADPNAFINVITLKQTFSRTTVDHPVFPTSGSITDFSIELTPPYSLFQADKDYGQMGSAEKFNLLEYHKWQFNTQWFWNVKGKWVLSAKVEGGYLGGYNKALGVPPFERFALGGAGMIQNGNGGLLGLNNISLRGYAAQSLDNDGDFFSMYNKVSMEVRYPISLSRELPPLWLVGFAEAGNGYSGFSDYNPLNLKRSAGLGFRTQLPMVGLFGLDWGYGFDKLPGADTRSGSQLHLIFGKEF